MISRYGANKLREHQKGTRPGAIHVVLFTESLLSSEILVLFSLDACAADQFNITTLV